MLLRVRVSVLDRPGSLLAVAKVLAEVGGNIADIEILATGDGRAIDDLVVDYPGEDFGALGELLAGAGAELLNVRRTVRLSGQRPDLDLLARVAAAPGDLHATLVSLAPPVYSADWAAVVGADTLTGRTSPGAPRPLPAGLPVPVGALPRRAVVSGDGGRQWEVVGVPMGPDVLYLGRADGPTFLQVELLNLRRVVQLGLALSAALNG